MRSGNPMLSEKRLLAQTDTLFEGEAMTFSGALNKTGLLLLILLVGAFWTWSDMTWVSEAAFSGKMMIGLFGGLIVAVVTAFKPHLARLTAPLYAFLEGMFLGGLSSYFEAMYPGIVIPAVVLTMGILIGLLVTYRAGLIPVTQKFRVGVLSATMGIGVFYALTWVLAMFGIRIPMMYDGGTFGILFSLFVVVIASMNLILDFDMIDRLSGSNAPKYMEWYGAFAIMVTLVWLYLEILRLLARSRN